MTQRIIAIDVAIVVVVLSVTLCKGQQRGTDCTAGGGECGTDTNLECFNGLNVCVCQTGYANDGANNCAYDCGSLVPPTHGSVKTVIGTTAGDPASYHCNNAYKMIGNASRTCIDGSGWDGTAPTCVRDIDECASNPCRNHGTCTDYVNSYRCTCLAGFDGLNCEIDVDECASSPCQNFGTCLNAVNTYSCTCLIGYTGTRCEIDIDECASNPCRNLGTCTDYVNSYRCTCLAGYEGLNCEIDVDECASHTCLNRGTCLDAANTFVCACLTGYSGTRCEKGCSLDTLSPNLNVETTVVNENMTEQMTAQFTCDEGGLLYGEESLICHDDYTWSGDLPICITLSFPALDQSFRDNLPRILLTDGPGSNHGRVEITSDSGQVFTLCQEGFNGNVAKVICTYLGYSGGIYLQVLLDP